MAGRKTPDATKDNTTAASTRTITVHGIDLDIDPTLFLNEEIIIYLSELDDVNGQTAAEQKQTYSDMLRLFRLMFPDDWRTIAAKLRDPKTHRIPMGTVTRFIVDTLKELNPNS